MKIFKNRLILLTFICLPIIVCLALFNKPSEENKNKSEYNRFWAYKVHNKNKYNMLILGDSRVYRGISSYAINSVLHDITILNFGFSAGKLNTEIYSEAFEKLDYDANIKIILLGISPGSLTNIENKDLHEIKKLTNSEILDRIYINYYASQYFSPKKPSDFFMSEAIENPDKVSEKFYDNGWVACNAAKPDTSKLLETYRNWWSKNKVSEKKIEELYSAIKEWNNSGIYIFAFRVPATLQMEQLEDSLSGFDENSLKNQIIVLGGNWIDLPDKQQVYNCYDGTHLDEKSAILLSEYLGTEIKKNYINSKMKIQKK